MRILLLNETGTVPHVGCLAVADAHARMLGAMGHEVVRRRFVGTLGELSRADEAASIDAALADETVRADIESCEAVVLNAEGSVHHGRGLQWLAVIGAAQRLGRRTLIVNAVLEESPGFDGVLSAVDDLCVRDARSAAYLASRNIPCRRVPDSFPHAAFSTEPAIDLSGRTVLTDWHPERNADVGRALSGLWASLPPRERFFYPFFHGIHRFTWRSAIATVATASLFVTARHHGVCLAGCAGIPFVVLPSNTYKIEGMIEASGLPIPVCRNPSELAAGIEFARSSPAVFSEFGRFIRGALPLSTFDALPREPGVDPSRGSEREVDRLAEHVRGVGPWSRNADLWAFGHHGDFGLPETAG